MVIMLNCSYKAKDGNTKYFMNQVAEKTNKDVELLDLRNILGNHHLGDEIPGEFIEFSEKLKKAEALVIGAPLYVDGLPAQTVRTMELLMELWEKDEFKAENLKVYAVSNLGFYEGKQIRHMLDMVRNWAKRVGATYGGGLAVGAGPLVTALDGTPIQKPFNKELFKAVENMAEAIDDGKTMENCYCKSAIPRFVYKAAAHSMFNNTLKENGVTAYGEKL